MYDSFQKIKLGFLKIDKYGPRSPDGEGKSSSIIKSSQKG